MRYVLSTMTLGKAIDSLRQMNSVSDCYCRELDYNKPLAYYDIAEQ